VERIKKSKDVKRDLAEEIDLLDTMLSSLVELLEQKGIVSREEWEKRIKERVTIK
jgi:DNA-binding HxlR family transcriptional regulator